MKIAVVKESAVRETDVVVCMPVERLPSPPAPSVRTSCEECDIPIWVAISSPAKARRFCIRCAMAIANRADGIGITDRQAKEIERGT